MAYTTGTASSVDDFLSQLVTFAVNNAGFTNQGQVTSSVASGSRTVYRVSKNGVHWFFMRLTANTGFVGRMSYSAFPDLGNPDSPGTAFQTHYTYFTTWAFTPPYVGHYFFTDGTCVHAAVEVSSGIYNHWSFGSVTKWGGWPGGEYLCGGYYNVKSGPNYRDWNSGYHCRPFNDYPQNQLSNVYCYLRATNTGTGSTDFKAMNSGYENSSGMFCGIITGNDNGITSMFAQVIRDAPNAYTNRTPIFPGLVRRYDYEQDSGLTSLAGIVPYVGFLKFPQDMNAKDIINTDWQVFPITMRTGGDETVASGSDVWAFAYRRV